MDFAGVADVSIEQLRPPIPQLALSDGNFGGYSSLVRLKEGSQIQFLPIRGGGEL